MLPGAERSVRAVEAAHRSRACQRARAGSLGGSDPGAGFSVCVCGARAGHTRGYSVLQGPHHGEMVLRRHMGGARGRGRCSGVPGIWTPRVGSVWICEGAQGSGGLECAGGVETRQRNYSPAAEEGRRSRSRVRQGFSGLLASPIDSSSSCGDSTGISGVRTALVAGKHVGTEAYPWRGGGATGIARACGGG